MDKKDLYEILKLDKKASKEDIKKSYKTLAKKYHPDSSENESKDDTLFKELNDAYQILSDDKKRKHYDSPRTFYLNQQYPKDIRITFNLTFLELKNGVVKKISFNKTQTCSICDGFGYLNMSDIEICNTCSGQGAVLQMMDTPFGRVQTHGICPTCRGNGKKVIKTCSHCKGQGSETIKISEEIKINSGYLDPIFVLQNKGNEFLHIKSNLIIMINKVAIDNLIFNRNNLHLKLDISLKEAIYGINKKILLLEEEFTIEEGEIKIGQNKVFLNKGLGKGSNLIIDYNIIIPNKTEFENNFKLLE